MSLRERRLAPDVNGKLRKSCQATIAPPAPSATMFGPRATSGMPGVIDIAGVRSTPSSVQTGCPLTPMRWA